MDMESWKAIVSSLGRRVDRVEKEGGLKNVEESAGGQDYTGLVYPVLALPLLTGLIILSILCGVGS